MKELFLKGGPLMYIIIAFSIIGLTVIIERLIYFLTVEKGDYKKLRRQLKEYVVKNDISGAKAICALEKNSVAQVLNVILDNMKMDKAIIEDRIKEVVLERITSLEKYMWLLKLTAHVSPLLGLLGTVTGMIKTFNVISSQGLGNKEMLAGGISEALLTTAFGLTVAIPALILFNYLDKKIDTIVSEMEKASIELLNIKGK